MKKTVISLATVVLMGTSLHVGAQPAGQAATSVAGTAADVALAQRIDQAFITLFPLYEMARARFNAAVHPLNPTPSPPNGTPVNRRTLIDHTARDVTTPNNDTLYSATWLDLHNTPVRVTVPTVDGTRYWSVAFLDAFTNNFAIQGRQTLGNGPLNVVLAGPHWKGKLPTGVVLRSPTNDVQLVGRFLVNGVDDASTVHRIQDGIRIQPLVANAQPLPQWVMPRTSADPENFLAVVNEMLARNPPDAQLRQQLSAWADLGVGGDAHTFARLPKAVQTAWQAQLPGLHEQLKVGLQHGAQQVNGWSVPSPRVGQFGDDYLLRATVAFGGSVRISVCEAVSEMG